MNSVLLVLIPLLVVAVVALVLFVLSRRGRRPMPPGRGAETIERPSPAPDRDIVPSEGPTIVEELAEEEGVEPALEELALEEPPGVVLEPLVRPSIFERLGKARSAFAGYLGGLVGVGTVDEDTWEEVEEALIRADVGVQTSMRLIEGVREQAEESRAESGEEIIELLKARMRSEISDRDRSLRIDDGETNVWLFVGVNGVGKTTTIGKLGHWLRLEEHNPLMAAGDTFRAAAAEQLTMWAERTGCDVVRGNEGGDPSAVIFDGIQAAAARGCDVVLADTAGRLQNKTNLMEELSKVRRVAGKEPGHVTEVLLVIDATTGQNGMSQAKIFAEAVEVTGVVLTKLDGSAKGGIVFAIESELGIPVKLVGLGEGVGDLVDFDPDEFVSALFEE